MSDSDIRLILAKLQEAVADIKKELLVQSREQVSLEMPNITWERLSNCCSSRPTILKTS